MKRNGGVKRRRGVAGLAIALALCGVSAPAGAQVALADPEVPFLTVRNQTGSDTPAEALGEWRSGLSAGTCAVRRLDFGTLATLADSAPLFVQEGYLGVDRVTLSKPARIFQRLQASASEHAPAIYVHGYFSSFEKGCRRAVMLQNLADLSGRFLWFTWPSDGAIANYPRDEADLTWSVPDLANAIIALERRFGDGKVDVVGHSLGARGVVLALQEVARRRAGVQLDEVVLIAADMDFGIFRRTLPQIAPIANRITVYVAENDHPLAVSAQLHGYPRLGEVGNDVSTLDGVEVIDVSAHASDSPTRHMYHIYSDDFGKDLSQLLNGGLGAEQRVNMQRMGPNSWALLEGDAEEATQDGVEQR